MITWDAAMIGKRFGRLTVIRIYPVEKWHTTKRFVRCRCTCGNDITVQIQSLVGKRTRSCGCLRKESFAKVAAEYRNRKRKKVSSE